MYMINRCTWDKENYNNSIWTRKPITCFGTITFILTSNLWRCYVKNHDLLYIQLLIFQCKFQYYIYNDKRFAVCLSNGNYSRRQLISSVRKLSSIRKIVINLSSYITFFFLNNVFENNPCNLFICSNSYEQQWATQISILQFKLNFFNDITRLKDIQKIQSAQPCAINSRQSKHTIT